MAGGCVRKRDGYMGGGGRRKRTKGNEEGVWRMYGKGSEGGRGKVRKVRECGREK